MVSTEVLAPVEAVVFDLDDTLFDHTGSTRRALNTRLSALDVVPSASLAEEWFEAEARHFEAWRAGVISLDEQRRRRLRDFLPLIGRPVGTDAALDSVFAVYLHCYEESWQAFDDAWPALDALVAAGLVVAVLTNGTTVQKESGSACSARRSTCERLRSARVLARRSAGVRPAPCHFREFRLAHAPIEGP